MHKKEKQNQAANTNLAEWRQIQGLLDKIRGTGRGGISADDPEAVRKLKLKLPLPRTHAGRPFESVVPHGGADIPVRLLMEEHLQPVALPVHLHLAALEGPALIFRFRFRGQLRNAGLDLTDGGAVVGKHKAGVWLGVRLPVTGHCRFPLFDLILSQQRTALQGLVLPIIGVDRFHFLLIPLQLRQLTDNAIYAAKHLDCLQPLPVEPPVPEQAGSVQGPAQDAAAGWSFYIIADLKTWADNAAERSELEHFPSFEAAKARFDELRSEPYNSEAVEPGPDGQPPARLTLGLESADCMSAADILHVRQGENYLVTDFTRSERLRDDPMVMDILSRVSCEIGFDRVWVWEQTNGGRQVLSITPFAEWENPWFPTATPGRIAAQYCTLLHECYPLPMDDEAHGGQIAEIVKYLQKEGKRGADQMALAVAGFGATFSDNAAVQKQAEALMKELAQYDAPGLAEVRQRKPTHRKSQER